MDVLIGKNEEIKKRGREKITIDELVENEEAFLAPQLVAFVHRKYLMPWNKKTLGSAGAFYLPEDAKLSRQRGGAACVGVRKQGKDFVILLPKEVSSHSLGCLGINIVSCVDVFYLWRVARAVALIKESLPHQLPFDCNCDKNSIRIQCKSVKE